MAKKRIVSGRSNGISKDGFAKQNSSKLGPINTFEDVADSEDEFHMNRDKVLLEDQPDVKRQKKWREEDELLEPSDEEVLDYSLSEDGYLSDDDNAEVEETFDRQSARKDQNGTNIELDESDQASENEARSGWGSSKRDYYNADAIETEADALEEEAEARKIQQKRLQELTDADFGFDEDEWQKAGKDEGQEDEQDEDKSVVMEVLPQLEITAAMTEEERMRLLRTRYPEFEPLSNEYTNLQPLHQQIALEAESVSAATSLRKAGPGPVSPAIIKYQSLSTYLGVLSMYFALLTSPAQSSNGTAAALSTSELRDHPIMDSLVRSRELWNKVKGLHVPEPSPVHLPSPSLSPPLQSPAQNSQKPISDVHHSSKKLNKRTRDLLALQVSQAAERASRLKAHNASLEALTSSLNVRRSSPQPTKPFSTPVDASNEYTDDPVLPAHLLAAKAAKKKSLRFYTSQITQKASRRKEAGAQAGGDVDLPYKERFRDRVARLNAEAEKRGKSQGRDRNTDLDGLEDDHDDDNNNNNDNDHKTPNHAQARNGSQEADEDDYYAHITSLAASKRTARASAVEAAHLASKPAYIPPDTEVADDGKRAITYAIEKNKGLAPKRKKEVRNPRVKKRNKYESKLKKLSSMRQVYKGGEGKGGYQGEGTGIKTNVIKSVKL